MTYKYLAVDHDRQLTVGQVPHLYLTLLTEIAAAGQVPLLYLTLRMLSL